MRSTFIMNFPKQKNKKGYSFKESDYKDLFVFLKRLEDDRIFFDNQIYDKDFFDYEKLEDLIKIFYTMRNEYIKISFEKLIYFYEIDLFSKPFSSNVDLPIMRIFDFKPDTKEEWLNLTFEQYYILDRAYKFEFDVDNVKVKELFPEYLYNFGWQCIKPVFCAYKDALFRHYDDDGNYRRIFDPFESGTFSEPEWLEYDENKKYNEFDIYSKTNTYAKYNLYNDVYYKDYKGEKFSTKSNFDFTDEEIKANFDNMVKNKTLVKFNHVIGNEKNKRYLDDFTDMLIKYESRKKRNKGGLERYTFYAAEDVKNYRYSMLNDPRNILILPIIDSFIELYRLEGYYDGDNSFSDFPFSEKLDVKMVFYYELTIEYQEFCAVRGWFYEDYTDIVTDEEFDEKEDMFFILLAGLGTFYWCLFIFLYYLGYSTIVYDVKNQLMMSYEALNNLHSYYISNKSHLYYDLINRKGRCTIRGKQLPPHFYYDCNLIFNRRRGRGFLPFGILDRITTVINNHDFLVRKMAYHLWNFGTFLGFR